MTDETNTSGEIAPVNDPILQLTAIPWYDSHTIRALLVAVCGVVGSILGLFGISEQLFDTKAVHVIDQVSELVTVSGVIWAGVARMRQPTPPVKLTQAKADAHNAVMLQSLPVQPEKKP